VKLTKVSMENFRAIGRMELPLDPDLTVLVGDNAAGKTSILDAIATGLVPVLTRCPKVSGAEFAWEDIRGGPGAPRRSPYARVRLTDTQGTEWDRHVLRDKTPMTRLQLTNPRGTRALFERLDPIIAARVSGEGEPALPVLAYYGTDRAVVLPPLRRRNFRAEHAPFEALRDALRPTASFKAMFEWFLTVETEELREQRDTRGHEWEHPQLQAVRRAVSAAIPGSRALRVVTSPLRLEVTLENTLGIDEQLALQQLSGGYRTLLALVADLARRMAQANPTIGTNSEAIVLIDEVDLHLHPRWQQTVLDDLRRAFPNAQFIVTTHSEQVIAAVRPDQVVRLARDPELGVTYDRPSSTYGATPDRVSVDVMQVPTLRRADVQRTLDEYWSLISAGHGEGERAQALRDTLNGWFRGQDSEMVRADAEIHRQKMLARLRGATP
jgi:predicted ATP-binding protein involved in virulence